MWAPPSGLWLSPPLAPAPLGTTNCRGEDQGPTKTCREIPRLHPPVPTGQHSYHTAPSPGGSPGGRGSLATVPTGWSTAPPSSCFPQGRTYQPLAGRRSGQRAAERCFGEAGPGSWSPGTFAAELLPGQLEEQEPGWPPGAGQSGQVLVNLAKCLGLTSASLATNKAQQAKQVLPKLLSRDRPEMWPLLLLFSLLLFLPPLPPLPPPRP